MKKIWLICLGQIMLLCSCEQTLPFGDSSEKMINVYAVAVENQPFTAKISHSMVINEAPDLTDENEISQFYSNELVIKDAHALVEVNGIDTYEMIFHEDSLKYCSNYIPHAGDQIKMSVSADGYKTITCETTVNEGVKMNNVLHEEYYDQFVETTYRDRLISQFHYDILGSDTISAITFSFHDKPSQKNYYRLKVRSVGENSTIIGSIYTACDVFTSADPVFYDQALFQGYGSWEAYFSNVFDDTLFDGQDYTITVNSRKRSATPNYIILELQSISKDFYYFLKSMQVYRISTEDVYSTPVSLYCNIADGWGILGSLSYDRHIIYY